MQRLGVQARFAQLVCHHFGRIFGGHKHKGAAPAVLLDQVAQQLGTRAGVYGNRALGNVGQGVGGVGHFHAHRAAQQALGQGADLWAKGGREKQALALRAQHAHNAR